LASQDIEDRGEGTTLSASIFKVLYATADGFEAASALEAAKNQDALIMPAAESDAVSY
jgi:hypothetical protein